MKWDRRSIGIAVTFSSPTKEAQSVWDWVIISIIGIKLTKWSLFSSTQMCHELKLCLTAASFNNKTDTKTICQQSQHLIWIRYSRWSWIIWILRANSFFSAEDWKEKSSAHFFCSCARVSIPLFPSQAYFDQVSLSFLLYFFLHRFSHFSFIHFCQKWNTSGGCSSDGSSRNAIYHWKFVRETYAVLCADDLRCQC